jgi:signal transduction histidine kinase
VNGGAIARRSGSPGASSPSPPARLWSWLADGALAVGRCFVCCALTLAGTCALAALLLVPLVVFELVRLLGGGSAAGPNPTSHGSLVLVALPLIAAGIRSVRLLLSLTRRLVGSWSAAPIATPYRQLPDLAGQALPRRIELRARWLLTDPASWRDLLWLAVNAGGGCALVAAPIALIAYGLACVFIHGLTLAHDAPLGYILVKGTGAPVFGIAFIAAGLWLAPRLLAAHAGLARLMLAPTRASELASQVTHLAQTRSETIDTGAAEMRRIERDLHDGAQARLVAMGMTLDAADQMLDRNPTAARALLAEARESSVKALAELRDLVRGIHPPLLADRGLAEAIRALTLDLPLRPQFASELAGRPPAAVESAAYFAVSELLANVSKHSAASRVWIDIRHSGGMLRISVADDGQGTADPAKGTGLAGIERRLAAFDGVLALSSPPGGPTVVNLEIPCALSSPKTSSC